MLQYYALDSDELVIGGVSTSALVAEYGTPLYVYDTKIIATKVKELRDVLPEIDLFFSLKANGNLAVAKRLCECNVGAEIASDGELMLAQRAGFTGENIIFAGPGKTEAELARAIDAGIYCINAESSLELLRIDRLARERGVIQNVALRINTRHTSADAKEKMGGEASKFGWDEETVQESVSALDLAHVRLMGVHVYMASGVLNTADLVEHARLALDLGHDLSQKLQFPLEFLDLGGGFGVPYDHGEQELDLVTYANELRALLAQWRKGRPATIRLAFELGRFLTAESGVYLTQVVDVKQSRGKTMVVTDGGMNQFLRPVFMQLNHPTFLANKLNQPQTNLVQIGGPTCTPLDFLAKDLLLPIPEPGDIVAVMNAGAYGFTMSMLYFLGHPLPAEVIVEGGKVALSRHRGVPGDLLVNTIDFD